MATKQPHTANTEPILVGDLKCLEIIFPDKSSRPSIRTFREWRAKGYYPHVKAGKRVFLEPTAVRKALMKRFTIEATEID